MGCGWSVLGFCKGDGNGGLCQFCKADIERQKHLEAEYERLRAERLAREREPKLRLIHGGKK